jgi:hypothetical protein
MELFSRSVISLSDNIGKSPNSSSESSNATLFAGCCIFSESSQIVPSESSATLSVSQPLLIPFTNIDIRGWLGRTCLLGSGKPLLLLSSFSANSFAAFFSRAAFALAAAFSFSRSLRYFLCSSLCRFNSSASRRRCSSFVIRGARCAFCHAFLACLLVIRLCAAVGLAKVSGTSSNTP